MLNSSLLIRVGLLCTLILCLNSALQAQPPCNQGSPEAGFNCDDFGPPLCDINEINGFCGRPPRSNPLNADEWCGANSEVTNGSVFRFFVNSANVNVRVYWDDCGFFEPKGIQAAVYEGCSDDFRSPISCVNTCFTEDNPAEFSFTGVPGQDYTLLVDGCFANRCNYIVEIITDNPDPVITVDDWDLADKILGPGIENNELCNGRRRSCTQYSISERGGASEYLWFLNGQLIESNENPFVNLNNDVNQLAGAELCVQGINLCDSNEMVCVDLIAALSSVALVDTCICPGELDDFIFRGDQFTSEVTGVIYEDPDICGCIDTTVFSLTFAQVDTTAISQGVCQEELNQGLTINDQLDSTPVTSDGETRLILNDFTDEFPCNTDESLICVGYSKVEFLLADVTGFIPDSLINCSEDSLVINIGSLDFYPERNALNLNIQWKDIYGTILGDNESVSIIDPGMYILSINYNRANTDIFSTCTFIDSFRIERDTALIEGRPILSVMDESCQGIGNGAILIRNPIENYSYLLNGLDITDDLMVDSLSVGTYELITRSPSGCEFRDTITINSGGRNEYNISTSDSLVFLGDAVTLKIDSIDRDELLTTRWLYGGLEDLDCSPCSVIAFKPSRSDSVILIVEDLNGCVDTVGIYVTVLNENAVFVPNIFSPNADLTENRFFSVFADETVESIVSVEVFSRSGALVYSANSTLPSQQLWDGSINGRPANSGVYVYHAVVRFINGSERSYAGDVTLMY